MSTDAFHTPPEETPDLRDSPVFKNTRKDQLHVGYFFVESKGKDLVAAINAKAAIKQSRQPLLSAGIGVASSLSAALVTWFGTPEGSAVNSWLIGTSILFAVAWLVFGAVHWGINVQANEELANHKITTLDEFMTVLKGHDAGNDKVSGDN